MGVRWECDGSDAVKCGDYMQRLVVVVVRRWPIHQGPKRQRGPAV